MPVTVHILNPGQGNISSVRNTIEIAGAKAVEVKDNLDLRNAERLILPGIGHFDTAMKRLKETGLDQAVIDFAASGKPLLGICLGMQLLGSSSEEGTVKGLGILNGSVVKMKPENTFRFKIPHNSWNNLTEIRQCRLLEGITSEDYFFFLHGYKWETDSREEILAFTEYESAFPVVIGRNNVYGVQFHPEKSHESGIKLLSNFLKLQRCSDQE